MKNKILYLVGFLSIVSCTQQSAQTSANPPLEEKVMAWRSPGGVDFQIRSSSANVTNGMVYFFRVGSAISTIVDWPNGKTKFKVKLRGQKALGNWPCAEIFVDAEKVGMSCTENGEAVFVGNFKKNKDQRILSIRFINDDFNPATKEDRNLMLVDFQRI